MNKKEVQKRVLKNGLPLALSKFSWDGKTGTFSSNVDGLVLDFTGIHDCTFKTYYNCTFKTSHGCTFTTSHGCTFNTGSGCTFKTGFGCTFTTSSECTFTTSFGCTFKTNFGCTFDTSSGCTFNTDSDCTFNTDSDCTFNTGSNCTFNTGYGCTFDTSYNCVIVRRDMFEVYRPQEGQVIQTCPYDIKGAVIDGLYNGKPHVIADRILSEVVKQKGNVYHVINHRETEITYLIKQGELWSHGKTLKEAKDSLIYKLADRDTSKYEGMTVDTVLSFADCVAMYRAITGACEFGTRLFVERQSELKKEYSIGEVIKLTKGQFGNELLVRFFNKGQK